jgi:hypothetical protein
MKDTGDGSLLWHQSPTGPGPSHYRNFTITLRHTTLRRTSLGEWSTGSREIYLTTHNTHTTDIHGPRRDSNKQFSKRAAADPRRPRGHRVIGLVLWNLPGMVAEIWKILQCSRFLIRDMNRTSLKMGPLGCPETSVRNYHYSLRNNPEQRSSHLLYGGGLNSRKPDWLPVSRLSVFLKVKASVS